jgi:hypothetical protein
VKTDDLLKEAYDNWLAYLGIRPLDPDDELYAAERAAGVVMPPLPPREG